MTSITFVRHGQTDWNRQRRIQGSTDIPLNEIGRDQAARAADALSGRDWDVIVSSPLSRAASTAEIIAERLRLSSPERFDGLVERSHGEIEGMTIEERQAAYPGSAIVPGLETREAVIARVTTVLREIHERFTGKKVLVVSHGAVIGSIVRHVSDGELPAAGQIIANGSFHDFEWRDDELSLVAFNPVDADPDLLPVSR